MNKKLSRILAGTLSAMFVGQVLIYGAAILRALPMLKRLPESRNLCSFPRTQTSCRKSLKMQ